MMSDSDGGDLSDVDDFDDLEMIMQQVQSEQQQEEEAERVCHRNYIYWDRLDAEARLMADYFGPHPKYPDIDCMHWEWRNCPKAWHGQFARGDKKVTFEKGYYLADDIYPQWSSFVKSFTVANSEKNALFKRKQESARKDVERAFGVLQGR
ncbi:ALP1-like protein isoform X1 [Tanacetum coccineum]